MNTALPQPSDATRPLESETSLDRKNRLFLAFSYFGQLYAVALFVLHGVYIFNMYYGASATAIGVCGIVMGFYNALNGLPIARLADAKYLNIKCGSCFPYKKCGRRGPWVALGLPQLALGCLFMFMPVSKDPTILVIWFTLTYFLVSTGFTASFQSTLAILQETMYTDTMRTRQTLMAVPFNVVAYAIAGAVVPGALFTSTPDGITQCCIQPKTSCVQGTAPCACYVINATSSKLSFVIEYATKCPELKNIDSNGHLLFKEKCVNATTTLNLGKFVLWGFISAFFVLTAYTAMLPASKSDINATQQAPLYLIPSIKEAFRFKSFLWLTWINFFNQAASLIVNNFIGFFLLYNVGMDYQDVGSTMATLGAIGLIVSALSNPCWHSLIAKRRKASLMPLFDIRHLGIATHILDGIIGAVCFVLADTWKSLVPLYVYITACYGILNSPGDQFFHAMVGWILDLDEQKNGLRREGMFYACNGAVQHLSIVFSFVLLAILGGLGQDPRLCPQAQNTSVKSAILGFFIFSRVCKVICAIGYFKYDINGKRLSNLLNFKRTSIHEAKFASSEASNETFKDGIRLGKVETSQ